MLVVAAHRATLVVLCLTVAELGLLGSTRIPASTGKEYIVGRQQYSGNAQ